MNKPDKKQPPAPAKLDDVRDGGAFAERLYHILLPQVSRSINTVDNWATLATLAGEVRAENQDRLIAGAFKDLDGRRFHIAAISDGMGGLSNGEKAASLTLATFVFAMVNTRGDVAERLAHATLLADRTVYRKFDGKSGATLSAVYIGDEGESAAVNVGDSRIYAFNSRMGRLSQISVDDTLAGLAQMGAKVDDNHNKGALLQYIGMGTELEPNVFPDAILESDDAVLLASDGIHWVGHSFLELITKNARDPVQVTKRLIQLAEMTGAQDNASVAVVSKEQFRSSEENRDGRSIDIEIWTPDKNVLIILDRLTIPASEVAALPKKESAKRNKQKRKITDQAKSASTDLVDTDVSSDDDERDELTFEFDEPKRVEDETSG